LAAGPRQWVNIADLIAAVLAREGHELITAANGRLRLAMLAIHQPDLMFLDFIDASDGWCGGFTEN